MRKVDAFSGLISTVAGGGSGSASGVPATSVALSAPDGLAVDGNGDLYISERNGHRVRKVDAASGDISTIAGNGGTGAVPLDGAAATSGSFAYPRGLALGGGSLYVGLLNRIRRVDLGTGAQTVVAGNGSQGSSGDYGNALSASVDWPGSLYYDSAKQWVYFVEDSEGASPSCSPCSNKVRVINDGYVDLVGVGVSSPATWSCRAAASSSPRRAMAGA